MKLSTYAKNNGITYKTALNWFHTNQIPTAHQLPNGTIIVNSKIGDSDKNISTAIYCRVSNTNRRKELDYQVERIEQFCLASGIQIDKVYKEVASGMNDNRKQFWKMIDDNHNQIVIENKDRLTRFGFKYLEKLLDKQGTKILVIHNDSTDEQDLIKDLVSVITSFCCRLYGLRRGYKKALVIKTEIENNNDNS